MAGYSCKDINGNEINQFVFSDDGVVYGLVNVENSETNYDTTLPYDGDGDLVLISSECCSGMGFSFDSNDSKCYYQKTEPNNTKVKIVFNVNQYEGLHFNKLETDECSLNLKFDFLIEYDSKVIFNRYNVSSMSIQDILNSLNLSVLIEKYSLREMEEGQSYESPKTYYTILEEKIYDGFETNQSTGIILSGDEINFVNNTLKTEMGDDYNQQITNSQWLHLDLVIEDPTIINQIVSEEVKFSILVNENACDFSFIMDNIELKKTCNRDYIERRTIDESPSFNIIKVIDNKKSWVNSVKNREHNLPIRETDYETEDERLVINSKVIELSTDMSDAINGDVFSFTKDNMQILEGVVDVGHPTVDISPLITTEIKPTTSYSDGISILQTELIDVKNRKGVVSYPTLGLLYHRYLNSEEYNAPASNKYTYDVVGEFIETLGNNWVELIEQVIPSTTLWGSTDIVSNSIFRENKFNYRKYALLTCNKGGEFIAEDNNVEVIVNTVDVEDEYFDKCNNIYIQKISEDCSTIGTVTIIGDNINEY